MIADLQDTGKSPDEKQRFTIRRIIWIIEDKWDINNLVGKGSNPQVVLFNLWIILAKTSQESGWNVSKLQCIQALLYLYQQTITLVDTFPEEEIPFWYYEFSQ